MNSLAALIASFSGDANDGFGHMLVAKFVTWAQFKTNNSHR